MYKNDKWFVKWFVIWFVKCSVAYKLYNIIVYEDSKL